MNRLTIYTDGGSRGNPGPAACAAIFQSQKKLIAQSSWYLGEATNNQAEYQAVLYALRFFQRNPHLFSDFDHLEFILDSQLVVKQLTGQYKIKDQQLQQLVQKIQTTLSQLEIAATFRHILRDKNHRADQLLNQELDLRQ